MQQFLLLSGLIFISGLQTEAEAATAVLSNTRLPRDTAGNLLKTGEASVLVHRGTYYFYFNNWYAFLFARVRNSVEPDWMRSALQ